MAHHTGVLGAELPGHASATSLPNGSKLSVKACKSNECSRTGAFVDSRATFNVYAPERVQFMSNDSKLSAAANLLLASRLMPAGSGAALITALGKHPLVAQGKMLKALHPNLANPSQLDVAERNPGQVTAEAIGTTRTPLTSIAELGQMIRDARKAMKMNQTEFAAHAGVGRRFVSELEGGKPSLEFDKVLACAAAAGVDLFAKKRRA